MSTPESSSPCRSRQPNSPNRIETCTFQRCFVSLSLSVSISCRLSYCAPRLCAALRQRSTHIFPSFPVRWLVLGGKESAVAQLRPQVPSSRPWVSTPLGRETCCCYIPVLVSRTRSARILHLPSPDVVRLPCCGRRHHRQKKKGHLELPKNLVGLSL